MLKNIFVSPGIAVLPILLLFISFSCAPADQAKEIVNHSIIHHGGNLYQNQSISFDFRERSYEIFKSPTAFRYVRTFEDSTGVVKDVLDNSGFIRTINGTPVNLDPEKEKAYTNSVNSVAYFAFLPYGLNDPAVFKEYLGTTELEGTKYHKIKVTFSEEGGGEDFEDEFIYWFREADYQLGFLAYSYHTDGGGVRFRKVIQVHKVGGLLLMDFENYKPKDKSTPLEDLEELYRKGELDMLSQILLENIKVVKQ
jgi:hypothetical protein